jgi:hypothetical protein
MPPAAFLIPRTPDSGAKLDISTRILHEGIRTMLSCFRSGVVRGRDKVLGEIIEFPRNSPGQPSWRSTCIGRKKSAGIAEDFIS